MKLIVILQSYPMKIDNLDPRSEEFTSDGIPHSLQDIPNNTGTRHQIKITVSN